jgi:hypothetical protein
MKANREATLEAIKGSGGIISTIAKRLNVCWHSADAWCNRWEDTKRALQDEREIMLDDAETVLRDSIVDGRDIQSAKWLLAMKGKQRGYVERREVGADEETRDAISNIRVNIILSE